MLKALGRKYSSLPVQVRASVWFFVCSILQRGISTITTPIFTRLLTTAEYGSYSVFNSWLGILTIIITMNFSAGVYNQGLVKFDKEQAVYSSSLQGLVLTMTAGWTCVYLLFRDFWNALFSLTTVQMLAMLLMIWASAAFNFWAGEQRVKYSYRRLVAVTIAVSLAKPIVGIVFVLHAEDKVTARILGLALVELVCYTGLFVTQMKRGKRFFDGRFWKYAVLFNLPLIPHYLSQVVLSSSDRIMISSLIGDAQAGVYGLAYSISQVMLMVNSSLYQTLFPWTLQKIKAKRVAEIAPVVYAALALVAIANILLIAFAPELLRLFAPPEYYDAVWVIPPISMSVFFMFTYEMFVMFELYYEKRGFMLMASIWAAVLNIILNYIFIRRFGYYAAGYTTLLCYVVNAVAHYLFMQKVCRKNMGDERVYSRKVLMGISAVFSAVGFSFLFAYRYWYIRYAIVAVLALLTFLNRRRFAHVVDLLLKRSGAGGRTGDA